MVDTNVGPVTSPSPVPLVQNELVVDAWPRQRRMTYDALPGMISDDKWWRLEVCEGKDQIYMGVCCFTELECLPLDLRIMIAGTGKLGLGWF